jgi:DNA-binding SARP family transcriptional activator
MRLLAEAQAGLPLRVTLLGGFRVDRDDLSEPVSNWQRRSAKALTKVLATFPGHALHREQVLEILWPGADLDSALNSFGKTLHAARRAFQPGLLPRERSLYLRMTDSMVALDREHVVVDADQFEAVACEALRRPAIGTLEHALADYGGDLLPEDRYADWCAERRDLLADLRVRVLLALADLLEDQGAYNDCANHLRAALQQDPTREEVQRRLMRLYTRMGTPDQAVRQFHACEEVLQRQLNLAPQEETVAVYQDILSHRTSERGAEVRVGEPSVRGDAVPNEAPPRDPFIGRAEILDALCAQLAGPSGGDGLIVVSGEAGIGKTRLLQELAKRARDEGAVVLWGGAGAHAGRFAYGPFAIALEGYVAARPSRERRELARRYPTLERFLPSLLTEAETTGGTGGEVDDAAVVPAMVRLLSDIALRQPVLLVLGDLHEADERSLDITYYLAQLALGRRWLLIGAIRDEEVQPATAVARWVAASMRAGLCRRIELPALTRAQCRELVGGLRGGATASAERADQIYALSCGNPLFIRGLVDVINQQPGADDAGSSGGVTPRAISHVPSSVRALVDARLALLDRTVQRVLFLAAAADTEEISLADLRAGAAALDPPVGDGALLDALDVAVETRLLEERKAGYLFRHPLVRQAVSERLSHHRRAQLGDALRRKSPRLIGT